MTSVLSTTRPRSRSLLAISFISFILLSFPHGMLGIAWPSIRDTFGMPLEALGILLFAATTGHIATSFSGGLLVGRLGVGVFLLLSVCANALGLLGYVLAPAWWVLILAAAMSGVGGGAMDMGLNAFFASNYSARMMNWLHASFGLGVTLGPIAMTWLLDRGSSWRMGYLLALAAMLVLAIVYIRTLAWWPKQAPALEADNQADAPPPTRLLSMSVVWLSLAVFFFVSGMEATAGNWAFTLFTEGRGETIVAAGQWVSAYWASFTAGRVLFGLLGERLAPVSVLRGTMLLAMLGAGLLWWHPTDGVSYLGLVLFGLALAPMFPLLILETPRRVGKKYADQVIGFQIGVAGLGLAALPALAGVLADRISLEIVPPFVVIGIVILIIFHETVLRRGATS